MHNSGSTADASSKVLALSEWIDTSPGYARIDPETAVWRRVSKVAAEAGEALDALGGYVGENPRKGVYKTCDDVVYELLDVALAALGAAAHMHRNQCDPIALLVEHIDTVHSRAGLA